MLGAGSIGGSGSGPGGSGDGSGSGSGAVPPPAVGPVVASRVLIGGGEPGTPPRPENLDAAAVAAIESIGIGTLAVPGLVVGLPGALVLLAVTLQLAGGSAWLPLADRWLAGIGVRRRSATRIVRDTTPR
jgi:hypothetical protein